MTNSTNKQQNTLLDTLINILLASAVCLAAAVILPLVLANYITLSAANLGGTYYANVPLSIDVPLGTKIYYTSQQPDSELLSKDAIYAAGEEYTGTCFVTDSSRISAVAVYSIGPNVSISKPLYLEYTIIKQDFHDEQFNVVFEETEEAPVEETTEYVPEYTEEFDYQNTYTWYDGITEWMTTINTSSELLEKCRSTSYLVNGGHDHKEYANSQLCREYVREIAEGFREAAQAEGYSEEQLLNMVITFVQSIPYEYDRVSMGVSDYPRFSAETLVDGLGDCEDSSVLMAEMLICLGYDTVLLISDNHAMLGVAGGDFSGSCISYNGQSYFMLETTGEGYEIGEYDYNEYDYNDYYVYPLH